MRRAQEFLVRRGGGIARWLAIEPPDWMLSALCAQIDVGDVFYPETGQTTKTAKAICRRCPVTAECLDLAISYEAGEHTMHGIWGGLTARERIRLRRQRRAAAHPPEAA